MRRTVICGTSVSYTHLDVYKRQVIQCLQIAVAECQQTGIHPALITLLAFAFQVHLALCGHDVFYIIGLAQGFHPHIIIHAQQDVFQIGTGEAVFGNFTEMCIRDSLSSLRGRARSHIVSAVSG